MKLKLIILLLGSLVSAGVCWDSEELEIFDLVEEVNKNFYEFMQIEQEATASEIKRAFRSLSIVLHPDKNPAEDANIQFRNLVAIYDVLKDPQKREKYNKVLKEGLPNWKSALYYYRRMRKIGLYEGSLILFVIFTVGQYMFSWAAYLEKKYTAETIFASKLKKLQKKNKSIDMDTILSEIPIPSILNTLPFQIVTFIWNSPKSVKNAFTRANELKELALEKRRLEIEANKRQEELEKEFEEQARLRKEKKENLRKRKQNEKPQEKTDEDLRGYAQIQGKLLTDDDAVKPAVQTASLSGGFWTDEDLNELVRLVKKYPAGCANRWGTIAEAMNRTVTEVTFMAAKMKDTGYRLPNQSDSVAENIVYETQEAAKKERVKKTGEKNILVMEMNWSQEQQRALESAITKYRKTAVGDRWHKISTCVPGKTKEECLLRYKYLCQLVKAQKEAEVVENAETSKIAENETRIEADDGVDAEAEELLPADKFEAPKDVSDDFDGGEKTKKKGKREARRRRRNLSSDEESDDAYQYEIN